MKIYCLRICIENGNVPKPVSKYWKCSNSLLRMLVPITDIKILIEAAQQTQFSCIKVAKKETAKWMASKLYSELSKMCSASLTKQVKIKSRTHQKFDRVLEFYQTRPHQIPYLRMLGRPYRILYVRRTAWAEYS